MSHISRAQPPHVLVASTVQGLAEDVWLLIIEGDSILWSPGYLVSLIWVSTGLNVYVPMSSLIWEKSEAGSPRTWSPWSQMGPELGTCPTVHNQWDLEQVTQPLRVPVCSQMKWSIAVTIKFQHRQTWYFSFSAQGTPGFQAYLPKHGTKLGSCYWPLPWNIWGLT